MFCILFIVMVEDVVDNFIESSFEFKPSIV